MAAMVARRATLVALCAGVAAACSDLLTSAPSDADLFFFLSTTARNQPLDKSYLTT